MFEKYKKVYKADYEKWYKENEAYRQRVAADQDRLKFHLMPKTGWLNDPNGLCQFNGTYHIYYQYTPFEPTGELKTWGHYTTKDFIHYEDFGPVVFPDEQEVKVLLVLAAADANVHLDAMADLAEILIDDDKMKQLFDAKETSQIKKVFN